MEKLQRNHKRILIIGIYLVIFFLLGWMIYSWLRPAETCVDKKMNQNETGIDCGGVCGACEKVYETQDLIIKEKAFVPAGQGKYDAMLRISNPNNQIAGSNFSYNLKLIDVNGNILAERSGKNFILPVESKYIIETDFQVNGIPAQIEATLSNPVWEEFFGYERPELNIYSKSYDLISSGIGYSEAKGLLRNESSFDFNSVIIKVVLRDAGGQPIAFNKTEMNTINAGGQRDFRLLWPLNFPGDVQGVEMEAEADVFNTQNFIKKYTGSGAQQFQRN
jgi:hypothetical protein